MMVGAAPTQKCKPSPLGRGQGEGAFAPRIRRAHGGFGDGAKFPLAAPVAFALRLAQRDNDEAMLDVAVTTLDRMGWDGLSAADDGDAGAFHHACARADWTEPDRAHLLDVQADMIRLYLDAWTITGAERYRDRARDAWAYVDRTLHDRAERRLLRQRARRPGRSRPADRRQRADDPHAPPRLARARRCDAGGNGGARGRAHHAGGVRPRRRRRARPRHARARPRPAHRSGARQRRDARPRSGLRRSHLPRSLRRADALQPPQALGRRAPARSSIACHPPPAPATSACSATRTGRSRSTPKPRACSNGSAVRPATRNSCARAADVRRWLDGNYSSQGISSAEYGLVLLEIERCRG